MALRARIILPPPAKPLPDQPWHKVLWAGVRARQLIAGARRLEGETYLSSGYGIKLAIRGKPRGWAPFGKLAAVWMPGRLKGIQVGPNVGTPFLAATQVFDVRPIPRKWLALARTSDAKNRFVKPGQILVTCSGTVGRSIVASAVLDKTLVSHDLLRIDPRDPALWGWLYAFLRSPHARAMATSSHYGQIIKHLEPEHLNDLPIPEVDDRTAADFTDRVSQIIKLRDEGHRLTLAAEALFEDSLGLPAIEHRGERPALPCGPACCRATGGGWTRRHTTRPRRRSGGTLKQGARGSRRSLGRGMRPGCPRGFAAFPRRMASYCGIVRPSLR